MRTLWMTCLLLLAAVGGAGSSAQTAATGGAAGSGLPALPKEPAAIFAAAAPLYDFSAPTLKPWHMKVSYQLYDEKEKVTTTGNYEYWWATADTYRSTWSRPGMEQTDWHVKGQHFHFSEGPQLEFYERKLQSDLLAPLPDVSELVPEKVGFERRELKFGSMKLPCVMVVTKLSHFSAHADSVPMGLFPTYCFSPDAPMLRAYFSFGSMEVLYNKIVRVQGVYLSRELTVMEGDHKVLTATVDLLQGLVPNAKELTPRPELVGEDGISGASYQKDASSDKAAPPASRRVLISSGVAAGNLLAPLHPVYPPDAKNAHLTGKVTMRALIGTDGRIHDLSVIDGPSASLIISAMRAASAAQYKPYVLAGKAVEVETTINIIYQLGP